MKKVLLFIIGIFIFSSLYQGAFAVQTQIGTMPQAPLLKIRENDEDLLYVIKDTWASVYDKSGNFVQYLAQFYDLDTASVFVIDTENFLLIFYNPFTEPSYHTYFIRYNKNTGNFSSLFKFAGGNLNGPCYDTGFLITNCSHSTYKAVVDEYKLVFALGSSETKYYLDLQEDSDSLNFISYSGSIQNASMEALGYNSLYRASLNNLNYLKEGDKTYNWIYKDTQGDIIRVFDGFATTYNLYNYSYLYNYQTNKTTLSIMGSSSEDMRAYYDYEIGSTDYIQDEYYTSPVNGNITQIQPSSVMGYDYSVSTFNPNIDLMYVGGEYVFYWVTSTGAVWKDADINIDDFLYPFPGTGGTGSVDPAGDVFNIFDFDQNGDGEISVTEAITGFFQIPGRLFDYVADYIQSLIDFILGFTDYEPPEFQHLFVGNGTYGGISGALMEKLDQTPDLGNGTIFSKLRVMLQYGLYFLIATLFLAVFVAYRRRQ